MPKWVCSEAGTNVPALVIGSAFSTRPLLWSSWTGMARRPSLLYFLLLCCACADSLGKFLWLARGFVARLASEVTLGSAVFLSPIIWT